MSILPTDSECTHESINMINSWFANMPLLYLLLLYAIDVCVMIMRNALIILSDAAVRLWVWAYLTFDLASSLSVTHAHIRIRVLCLEVWYGYNTRSYPSWDAVHCFGQHSHAAFKDIKAHEIYRCGSSYV